MKLRLLAGLAALSLTAMTVGCASGGSDEPAEGETQTLQIAATVPPMSSITEVAAEEIGDGYEIEMVEVSDYVQPNVLLNNKEIDGNFVQHADFLADFNEENGGNLVLVQPVYVVVVAFYSREYGSLDELPDGASVVIPNDSSNGGRALQMLADEGLITLDPDVERHEATLRDVIENPKDLQFTEVGLPQLNTAYDEADLVYNIPSNARQIDLRPYEDGLFVNDEELFAVGLAVHADDVDTPMTEALIEAYTSDVVREKLEELEEPAAF